MKHVFIKGDQKVYKKKITTEDLASFHGERLHNVYSTFALARDFEWSSRLFFLEMKEPDEEGVGTFLQVDHKSPAFVDEEVVVTATVESISGMELICSIDAWVNERLIAKGRTGQKMLKKEKLKLIFTKP